MRLSNRASGVATRASSDGAGRAPMRIVSSGGRPTVSVTPAAFPIALARVEVSGWQLGPPG